MKRARWWKDGVLIREVADGVEVSENIGKTSEALGIKFQNPIPPKPLPPIKAIPRDQWPLWAKSFVLLSKPEDLGIGDVVARMIGDENSEAFKTWYKKITGRNCGCNGRQARWNLMYPL